MPAYFLEIYVVALGLVLLMVEAFFRKISPRTIGLMAIAGLVVAFGLLFIVQGNPTGEAAASPFWSYYTADRLALFYKGFAIFATLAMLIIGLEYEPVLRSYLSREGTPPVAEYFILPLFACAGIMWMASANDLTSIFIALEIVTMSFYVLVAYMRRNVGSLESGTKLLILGALSTGFFVYGISWLYGITGETNLEAIKLSLQTLEPGEQRAALFAFALILVGLGFKIGAFPFQIWIPDVYQGAPTPTTAFLSSGSKAAGVVVLSRMIEPFLMADWTGLASKVSLILSIIAGATIAYGYLAAIPQTNFKRLLAYASIASAGGVFLALSCSFSAKIDVASASVAAFYLASHLPGLLACFLGIAVVRKCLGGEEISHLNGLGKRAPLLGFAMMLGVASLAGIPPLGGFWGKLWLVVLGVDQGRWIPVALLIVGTAASFYVYFNVIRAMYWNDAADDREVTMSGLSKCTLFALIALMALMWLLPLFKYLHPKGGESIVPTALVEKVVGH